MDGRVDMNDAVGRQPHIIHIFNCTVIRCITIIWVCLDVPFRDVRSQRKRVNESMDIIQTIIQNEVSPVGYLAVTRRLR